MVCQQLTRRNDVVAIPPPAGDLNASAGTSEQTASTIYFGDPGQTDESELTWHASRTWLFGQNDLAKGLTVASVSQKAPLHRGKSERDMTGLGINQVHCGDCLELLERIEPGTVDLAFADPPFNIGYKYDVYEDRRSRREYLDWSRRWISNVSVVLKPTGTFWLAIGDEYAAELKLIAQDEAGFHCRSWVIWYYTFGVNCFRGFSRSHTHLFHFVKDPACFTFNGENPAVRVLSARQLVYRDGRANPKGRLPDNTWIFRPQDAPPSGFAPSHDTWYFSRVAGTFREREGFHGCQMPEQLLGRIIRISSHPQDLVLDPFAGSGTTLVVAKKLGRRWLGIELSSHYVRRIRLRLKAAQTGDPLDGPADPVRSAPKTSHGRRGVRIFRSRPLPESDQTTERAIISAFQAACADYSADQVLCDPEVNARFIAACAASNVGREPFTCNRLLLRLRKRGKLPKLGAARRRLDSRTMDPYSDAAEIAMQLMSVDYGYSLDDLLCSPEAAAEFDRLAAEFAPGYSPAEYRWAAISIRKRARSSKALAKSHFSAWLRRRSLPPAAPLSNWVDDRYAVPGVYVVFSESIALYVGETFNLLRRLEGLSSAEGWKKLTPTSVLFLPCKENTRVRHGLQTALIQRVKPLLNSQLLRLRPAELV